MNDNKKLSIWIGSFDSEKELKSYLKEEFSDDKEGESDFMTDFDINYIDNQFTEVLFENEITENSIFDQFSYGESFRGNLPEISWENKNSIIILYNYSYEGKIKSNARAEFVGNFNFQESLPDFLRDL